MLKPPSSRTCTCTGAHEYGQIPQCHAADVNLKILCAGPEIFHSDFQTSEVFIATGIGSECVVVCWLLKMSKLLALIQNSGLTTCWRCESVKWPNESKPVRLICVTSSLALTVHTLTCLQIHHSDQNCTGLCSNAVLCPQLGFTNPWCWATSVTYDFLHRCEQLWGRENLKVF